MQELVESLLLRPSWTWNTFGGKRRASLLFLLESTASEARSCNHHLNARVVYRLSPGKRCFRSLRFCSLEGLKGRSSALKSHCETSPWLGSHFPSILPMNLETFFAFQLTSNPQTSWVAVCLHRVACHHKNWNPQSAFPEVTAVTCQASIKEWIVADRPKQQQKGRQWTGQEVPRGKRVWCCTCWWCIRPQEKRGPKRRTGYARERPPGFLWTSHTHLVLLIFSANKWLALEEELASAGFVYSWYVLFHAHLPLPVFLFQSLIWAGFELWGRGEVLLLL